MSKIKYLNATLFSFKVPTTAKYSFHQPPTIPWGVTFIYKDLNLEGAPAPVELEDYTCEVRVYSNVFKSALSL